jgi:hypothetical protein
MQIRQQVIDILLVHRIPHRRHQPMPMQNRRRYPLVVSRRSTRQCWPLEHSHHRRPMQRLVPAIIVAHKATRLKHRMPTHLLRIQLLERRRWRPRLTPGQRNRSQAHQQNFKFPHPTILASEAHWPAIPLLPAPAFNSLRQSPPRSYPSPLDPYSSEACGSPP